MWLSAQYNVFLHKTDAQFLQWNNEWMTEWTTNLIIFKVEHEKKKKEIYCPRHGMSRFNSFMLSEVSSVQKKNSNHNVYSTD